MISIHKIKQYLKEHGIRKEQLAVDMGCSISTVYNLLGGRDVSIDSLIQLKKVMDQYRHTKKSMTRENAA